jgi:hypothetical protein
VIICFYKPLDEHQNRLFQEYKFYEALKNMQITILYYDKSDFSDAAKEDMKYLLETLQATGRFNNVKPIS